MTRHTPFIALLLLAITACNGQDDKDSIAPDTDDTAGGTDTADPGDTSDTDDTGSLDTGDTADTGTPPDPEETLVLPAVPPTTTCTNPVPTPSSGDCGHTAGSNNHLLLHVDTVLGPLQTLEGGAQILVDAQGEIACVACDCTGEAGAADADVVTCPTGVASPGLINAHDHITFDEKAPFPPTTTRYEHRHDWRGSLSTPGNANGDGTRWAEARQLMAGTTSMLGSGGQDGFVRNLDRSNRDEGLGIVISNQTFPLGDGGRQFRSNCGWSYAEGDVAVAGQSAWIGHVAEGIDNYAAEEIRCLSSALDGGEDLTQSNTSHVHSVGLQAVDYAEMAREGTTLVWSPRTNIFLYGHTAKTRLFDTLGGRIALGTDWTYSGSAHILRELSCVDGYNTLYLDAWFSDVDLWRMVTENGAWVVDGVGEIGRIREGYVADIAIFEGAGRPNPYRAVIEAEQYDTLLVLRGGEVLFGDATAVQGLDSSCDTVDVCGEARAICSDREFGEDWSAFASQMSGKYPAIFCDTPQDEPTCTPFRSGEFDGTITLDDEDGDGIVNAQDNCPRVFNPVRPIDGGVQPDADDDGQGDACDATPIPDDVDGDGVTNDLDVCWRTADANQDDADADGFGDVCDACPDDPSPTGICLPPATPMPDAKDETDGSTVTVAGVVTAVFEDGRSFFLQDTTVTTGIDAGIRVFTGGNGPTLSRGDTVRVTGELDTYFDSRELDGGAIVVTGTASLSPISRTVSQATSEDYEGVLVTLTDATVSDANHDCTADVGSCGDDDLWEVGGPTGIVVDKRAFEGSDSEWNAGKTDGPITGVMDFRFDRRRIHPRTAADLP